MSSDAPAVVVNGVSKRYEIYARPEDRLKQFVLPRLRRWTGMAQRQYFDEFWALKDANLRLRQGETLGVIGRNGAGKSTLLQIIAGTVTPTSGAVTVAGRVSALLELGAGFNPEFSGRDNVFMYAAILGLSRPEIQSRFIEIHEFSGIGDFIDEPVRTYSSGMFARLAFSVAVHCEPSVLIVDEALSVGDMEFQERSITRMKEIRERGTTVLLVTHSVPTVRNFCDRAIWLDRGRIRMDGTADEVCRAYVEDVARAAPTPAARTIERSGSEGVHESGKAKTLFVTGVRLSSREVRVGDRFEIVVDMQSSLDEVDFGVGLLIRNDKGKLASVLNTVRDDIYLGGDVRSVSLAVPAVAFPPGKYFVTVSLCDHQVMFSYDLKEECAEFDVVAESNRSGIPRWEGTVASEHVWSW